jgi:flavin reductase (DIM6/NTAB) family NADH-FMN oxidoreductase RutF
MATEVVVRLDVADTRAEGRLRVQWQRWTGSQTLGHAAIETIRRTAPRRETRMLFDLTTLKDENAYKLLVSTVVPRPIAWVTTQDIDGTVNAAPFSFFNAVSGKPPVVAIGIGGRAPGDLKDTGGNIRRTGQFVVNLVSNALAEKMNITAIEFGKEVHELEQAGLTTAPSTHVKPPRIAESPVSFECERLVIVEVGVDRGVVLGSVLAIHVRDEFVLDPVRCYVDTPKLDLIGRMHGGGWYARTTDRFELPRIPVEAWPLRPRVEKQAAE